MAARARRPDFNLTGELEFEEAVPLLRQQKPVLRPDTDIIPQQFRGRSYFVLQDPATLQYYRVGPVEREILAQLDGETTLGTIHERLRRRFGDEAPSFRELAQFVLMLRHANLTVPEPDAEARWGVERAAKKRQRQLKQKLSSFMYLTIPLFDPDRLLNTLLPYVRWVFNPFVFFVWLATVVAAFVWFLVNFEAYTRPATEILAPDNLIYLWVGFVLIKAFHEFGHAFAAKVQGAEVHRMGVLFLIFMPCPYVDTTPVWAFPKKWHKVLVGCAGVMTELFIASLAAFGWWLLEPSVLRSVLYNMIFIASVSTLLFNGNPLLRYDAYYVLADLIEIPNLRQRSVEYLLYLVKRYLFGMRIPVRTDPPRDKAWYVGYGVLASIYRVFIVSGILLFIASKLFVVGVILSGIVFVLWIVVPLAKAAKFVLFDPVTRPVRLRAVGVCAVGIGLVAFLLGGVRIADAVRVPCALAPYEERVIRAEWPGFLEKVYVADGEKVEEGQLLAELRNDELEAGIEQQTHQIEATEARLRMYESQDLAAAQAEAYRLDMLRKDLELMQQRREALSIRSPFNGQVVAPDLLRSEGRFLKLGDPLLMVASLGKLRVVAVVGDQDGPAVRASRGRTVRIKFRSTAYKTFDGQIERISPAATHEPPPLALTNVGGGKVLLDANSPENRRTLFPWYRVDIVLKDSTDRPPVGVTGTARFLVGRNTIGAQFWLRFRRMLNRRFQII